MSIYYKLTIAKMCPCTYTTCVSWLTRVLLINCKSFTNGLENSSYHGWLEPMTECTRPFYFAYSVLPVLEYAAALWLNSGALYIPLHFLSFLSQDHAITILFFLLSFPTVYIAQLCSVFSLVSLWIPSFCLSSQSCNFIFCYLSSSQTNLGQTTPLINCIYRHTTKRHQPSWHFQ